MHENSSSNVIDTMTEIVGLEVLFQQLGEQQVTYSEVDDDEDEYSISINDSGEYDDDVVDHDDDDSSCSQDSLEMPEEAAIARTKERRNSLNDGSYCNSSMELNKKRCSGIVHNKGVAAAKVKQHPLQPQVVVRNKSEHHKGLNSPVAVTGAHGLVPAIFGNSAA
jgi:hypothetical protein